MTKYAVVIYETISHYIEVEAESEADAIDLGKELIGNESDDMLRKDYAYTVDSIGWDGIERATEID